MAAMADVFNHSWNGKLGKDISFKLSFAESTFGTLIGETTYYRKNGKTAVIKCFGYRVDYENGTHSFFLNEYDGTKVCGTFFIEVDNDDNFQSGTWSLVDKELQMNEIEESEDADEDKGFFSPVNSINEAVGEYDFTYATGNPYNPENGGNCEIKKKSPNTISWSMAQVTPNIAEANGESIFDNAYFKGEYEGFTFEAYVDKKFIYVKQTNTEPVEMEDYWGMAATIEGIYVRK